MCCSEKYNGISRQPESLKLVMVVEAICLGVWLSCRAGLPRFGESLAVMGVAKNEPTGRMGHCGQKVGRLNFAPGGSEIS